LEQPEVFPNEGVNVSIGGLISLSTALNKHRVLETKGLANSFEIWAFYRWRLTTAYVDAMTAVTLHYLLYMLMICFSAVAKQDFFVSSNS